jgi:hypothetical protein
MSRISAGDRVLIEPVDRVGPGGSIGEMWHGGLAEFARVPAHLAGCRRT